MSEDKFSIAAAEYWSDDKWFLDQENRTFLKNEGYLVVNHGEAKGTLVGGNLCTFNLLQGTVYMPKIENTIILMEEDNLVGNTSLVDFDRNLQSVIELKGFSKVKGILIGRFQKGSNISNEQLIKVVKAKEELKNIPIIANVNFGHTSPIVTLPIGGKVKIEANDQKVEIIVLEH
jgi:muramoyltetrapeptide carboxypeptidase LdcA involved in peptidoglycan recycling